jgi:hypothetical protein
MDKNIIAWTNVRYEKVFKKPRALWHDSTKTDKREKQKKHKLEVNMEPKESGLRLCNKKLDFILFFLYFLSRFFYSFIHMCIHCFGHFSPLLRNFILKATKDIDGVWIKGGWQEQIDILKIKIWWWYGS